MPVATLADVRTHLNIVSTASDTELTSFLTFAVDAAERWTGRILGDAASATEVYDGGSAAVLLDRVPVTTVSSVSENGSTLASTAWTVNYSTGVLTRLGGSYTASAFTPGVRNVSVTYSAGYATSPPAAKLAVLELVRHLWQTQRGSMPGRQQSGDDYNPALGYSMPQRVIELLEPLRVSGVA